MSRTVFISRSAEACADLYAPLQQHGLELIAIPQVTLRAVVFDPCIPVTDWIFFSSRNAVRFFFDREPELGAQRFAAIGEATAAEVRKKRPCQFTGVSADTAEVGRDFAALVHADTVLFPQSAQGLRTIQKYLDPSQVIDLPCYETIAAPQAVGFPDVLVFTSPENVRSFFRIHRMLDHQKAIAFGKSTQQALREEGVENVLIPTSLQAGDLIRAIIAAAHS